MVLQSDLHPGRAGEDLLPTIRPDPRDGAAVLREEALSVKILAERASRECTSNGVGYALMTAFFLEEVSWYSLIENEKWQLEKTIRRFRRELQAAGFLPAPDRDCRGTPHGIDSG